MMSRGVVSGLPPASPAGDRVKLQLHVRAMANVEGDTAIQWIKRAFLSLRENSSMFTPATARFSSSECQTECYAAGYLASHRQRRQLLTAIQIGKEIDIVAPQLAQEASSGLPTSCSPSLLKSCPHFRYREIAAIRDLQNCVDAASQQFRQISRIFNIAPVITAGLVNRRWISICLPSAWSAWSKQAVTRKYRI